jgi:pyruvate formate lyase activating enzyme
LDDGKILCYLCARYCRIPEGLIGFCGVRQNIKGKLYSLNYGRLIAMHVDPIEKKPLMHYKPGTWVMSIATAGCNFACQFCQNFDISQRRKVNEPYTSPEELIELTVKRRAQGLSYTYNEPTIFAEYAIDVMRLAHSKGLFNTWVTNGFMTVEALDDISKYLDAATVDFKGSGNREFYRRHMMVPESEPILDALLEMNRRGVFIEITDLIIPIDIGSDLRDLERLVKWIIDNLGPETPFHVLRFHPDYRMLNVPPTPLKMLEKHAEKAKELGLEYVYIGNVWGHPLENTYCPHCNHTIISRLGFQIRYIDIEEDRCPKCGAKLNIVM